MGEAFQNKEIIWQPQPGPQTALLMSDCDEILYGGARGGGKSDGLLGDCLHHIAENESHGKAIIFRRTLEELSELIDRAKEIYLPAGAAWQASKKQFKFTKGASLKFAYLERLEDALRYKGKQFTYIGIEEAGDWETDLNEAGQPTQRAVEALRATMRSAHGVKKRMVLTANPGGPGHDWVKAWFIESAQPMETFLEKRAKVWRVFIPALLEDNVILQRADPDYEAKLMASGSPWQVRAWRYGDWNARPEGGIIKTNKIQRYSVLPKIESVFHIWDTAFKAGQHNDYSCGGVFGATKSDLYVLDWFRRRVEYPELKKAAIDLASKNPASFIGIEDKASGQTLIQDLKRTTHLNVQPIKIEKGDDKTSRANAANGFIDAGRLHIPAEAPWCKDLIEELSLFDKGPHDDQVDVIVHGVIHFTLGRSHSGLMDFYREQVTKMHEERDKQKKGAARA